MTLSEIFNVLGPAHWDPCADGICYAWLFTDGTELVVEPATPNPDSALASFVVRTIPGPVEHRPDGSSRASTIRLTKDPHMVTGCVHLGSVEGGDHKNGGMGQQCVAESKASSELRENADKLGATTVVVKRDSTDKSGFTQFGEAYRCPQIPAKP